MDKRKNHNASLWVLCIVFLLLTALFYLVTVPISDKIPRVIQYSRSRLSEGITFQTYEKISDDAYKKKLAVCREFDAVAADRLEEVKPVLINERFFEVHGIYVGGSAITADHIENKIPAIVISDRAADRMSLDGNMIGQTVSLFGRDFTVVGIYQKSGGILDELSSDIYERVYIPYTTVEGYEELSIDTFSASEGSLSEEALTMLGLTESDPSFYLKNDLKSKHDITENLWQLFLSVISLVIAVVCLVHLVRLSRDTAKKLRTEYEDKSVKEIILGNKGYLLVRLLCAILLIGIPVTMILFFPLKIVIEQKYVPYDNIFDISHYFEVLKTQIRLNNTHLAVGDLSYQNLFLISFISGVVLLLILSVLLIVIAVYICKRAPYRLPDRTHTDTDEASAKPSPVQLTDQG